jgi:lipid-binding SYLF domain-containing protein
VFAGFNMSGSSISQDQDDTRSLYGDSVSLADILAGKTQAPGSSQPFLGTVEKYAGKNKAKD